MSNRTRLRVAPAGFPVPDGVREQFAIAARESATAVAEAPTTVTITEAGRGGTLTATGGRRYRARLIEGNVWGSSGYYSRKVVERDIPKIFPAGSTLMYWDHPTATEDAERPARSVRDMAARIVSTPVYEVDGMYADIEVFPHAAPLVESLADIIGLSIRAEGMGAIGTVAGRTGVIIESLEFGYSVDFVTKAGAGGKLVSLLEAARAANLPIREARNVGAYIESRLHLALTQLADDMYGQGRLTRDERIVLSNAIGDALTTWTGVVQAKAPQLFERDIYDDPEDDGATAVSETHLAEAASSDIQRVLADLVTDAYGGPQVYTWVRDYDADRNLAWFDVSTDTDCTTFQQSYATADDGALSLTGTRAEVVARTVYSPIETPDEADVAESAPPVTPAMPDVSTGGISPTAPIIPKEPIVGTESTGPAPGAAGPVDGGGQPTPVTEAALADANARVAIAETQRNEAVARAAALAESASAQARVIAERDSAIAESRQLRANEAARTAVNEALATASNVPEALRAHIGPRITDRIIGRVPLGESGEVSVEALRSLIANEIDREATYAAALLEAQGVGRVNGLGAAATVSEMSEADFETKSAALFRGIGLNEADAVSAAKGR